MCGNQLAIECEESRPKFASFEVELLLCLGLMGSSIDFAWFDSGEK